MSINTKMTAIANQIRALLGLSGTMGLDAMATNLATEQTNVNNAFTAVNSKGGTVPSSKVSGNLAAAINSIPNGVTVQRKSGTFTTNSSGNATVNCGFKPDLVYISLGESEDGYLYSASAAFAEETRSGTVNITMWAISEVSGTSTRSEDMYVSQTTNGFSVLVTYKDFIDFSNGNTSSKTFNYTAVKYT